MIESLIESMTEIFISEFCCFKILNLVKKKELLL